MEELLNYLNYNYIICVDIDETGCVHITGSSNRAIRVKKLRTVAGYDVNHVFTEYFRLKSKDGDPLSETEEKKLASIVNAFKTSKETNSKEFGISFDKAQVVFILPLGWDEEFYKVKLRKLFMVTEWITPEDDKNKLILVPFIQALVDYLQISAEHKRHLDRERSSLLFSMQPWDEDDMITFSYTRFQLQSAKELIAVSKTLASHDFFLVPSIRSNKSITLGNLDKVMHTTVKQILTSVQNNTLDDGTVQKEHLTFKIVSRLPYIYDIVCKRGDYNKTLEHHIIDMDWDKHQLPELKTWSWGQFIAAIFDNPNVKHYSKQVCEFFREVLDGYGAAKDSPDGIQHILLYNHFKRQDYRHYIMQALVEGSIIQPGNGFIDLEPEYDELAPYAMQRPIQDDSDC